MNIHMKIVVVLLNIKLMIQILNIRNMLMSGEGWRLGGVGMIRLICLRRFRILFWLICR